MRGRRDARSARRSRRLTATRRGLAGRPGVQARRTSNPCIRRTRTPSACVGTTKRTRLGLHGLSGRARPPDRVGTGRVRASFVLRITGSVEASLGLSPLSSRRSARASSAVHVAADASPLSGLSRPKQGQISRRAGGVESRRGRTDPHRDQWLRRSPGCRTRGDRCAPVRDGSPGSAHELPPARRAAAVALLGVASWRSVISRGPSSMTGAARGGDCRPGTTDFAIDVLPRRAMASGSPLRTSIRQAAPCLRSSRRQRGRRGSPGAGRPPRICLVGLSGARPGSLSRRPVPDRARGLDGRHFQLLSAGPDAAPVQPLGRSAPRRRSSSCELDAVWVDEEVALSHRGAPLRTHHRSSGEPQP